MSDLAARLRRLRGQAGAAGGAAMVAASTAPLPPDLARLLAVRRATPVRQSPRTIAPTGLGRELAPGLWLAEEATDWPSMPLPFDASFAKVPGQIDPADVLFLDTETTGLAGGTGTRAFMIGVARWAGRRFLLSQLTITTLAGELAMLEQLRAWLTPATVLATYNGKSYDAPLLTTRFRLERMASPLQGLRHIDLLHAVRRRWRAHWPNCKLATVERQLLGVVREDDLPGAQAPAAWLRFLRAGDPVDLYRVLQHNAQDLRSLAGVLSHMVALDPLASGFTPCGGVLGHLSDN
ncbi:ribonuclease H-like domain-containing protein [Dyella sp. 2RAB6]|uniref:ribonuclease H-like domain-containing protein n=1 Tax=Dyella sp. 2RAB6 TaxID=3232992 RepID=UPI003F8DEAC6